MKPVPCVWKGPDHRMREKGPNLIVMLRPDIGRGPPTQEKNRTFVRCNLQIRPVFDLVDITGEVTETDVPAGRFAQPDILQQEFGDRPAAGDRLQKIETFPTLEGGRKRDGCQPRNHLAMSVSRPGGRDIRNHQLRDALGGCESQHHSHFPAHGMPYDGKALDSQIIQRFQDVLSHKGIGDGAMRAVPMIAQIQRKGPEIRRCAALEKPEVPGPPEQPVQEDDRFRAFSPFDDMQFHQ